MTNGEPSRRLSAFGRYLTLFAIAAVVVVISLPRLREFALRENEADARALLARLGAALETHAAERGSGAERPHGAQGPNGAPGPNGADRPLAVVDLVATGAPSQGAEGDALAPNSRANPTHPRGLADAEFLDGGRLLRRHGYLFDVAAGPDQRVAVRAWPWHAGRTGQRAFVDPLGAPPLAHANPEARFSGPDGGPELQTLGPETGWTLLGSGD
ncbi:MAG: hypothetical protein L6Q99_07650 [Planctomycetes bacterium]|nr:hypothetical protein [Planctomycetota bacterium]